MDRGENRQPFECHRSNILDSAQLTVVDDPLTDIDALRRTIELKKVTVELSDRFRQSFVNCLCDLSIIESASHVIFIDADDIGATGDAADAPDHLVPQALVQRRFQDVDMAALFLAINASPTNATGNQEDSVAVLIIIEIE